MRCRLIGWGVICLLLLLAGCRHIQWFNHNESTPLSIEYSTEHLTLNEQTTRFMRQFQQAFPPVKQENTAHYHVNIQHYAVSEKVISLNNYGAVRQRQLSAILKAEIMDREGKKTVLNLNAWTEYWIEDNNILPTLGEQKQAEDELIRQILSRLRQHLIFLTVTVSDE